MKNTFLTFLVMAFLGLFTNSLQAKSVVDDAKKNGVKFVLQANEASPYNILIKDIVSEYWTFSDYTFITFEEYQAYTGDEEDYVMGVFEINIETEAGSGTADILVCYNQHKHITQKKNKITAKPVVVEDFIPAEAFESENLEAILTRLIKSQNVKFTKTYNGEKLNIPTTSYSYLKSKKSEVGTYPIYILKSDVALEKKDMDKIGNSNMKVVTQEEIDEAVLSGKKVLIYFNTPYLFGQSIKTLVNADSGECMVYVMNRDMDYYNKSILKNVLKQLAP
ncbi:hypothetical protein KFE94_06970 [bacterium SCSIO 12643]|nr:hypothetical protein KFE94_06970 [bacterium SCSIO 12643]